MAYKAIFLDRDDTLIEDPGYISKPEQVRLLAGAAEALVALRNAGYKLVIVSNQSGIARGYFTEDDLQKVHEQLEMLLAEKGAYLDAIYYCPYYEGGTVPEYTIESEFRKPGPGMLMQAAEEMDLDFSSSWMIGDSYRDVAAGRAAGCRTILIKSPIKEYKLEPNRQEPDHIAFNIREAVNIIMRYERPAAEAGLEEVSDKPTAEPQKRAIDSLREKAASAVPAGVESQMPKPASDSARKKTVADQPADRKAEDESFHPQTALKEILHHLRHSNRQTMYEEFSMVLLFAGIAQAAAIFCILMAIWQLTSASHPSYILVSLGFATVLELMCLTLILFHRK